MVGAKPSVSDQISDGGYCPKPHNPRGKDTWPHCGVYINDGFYHNCRSWIGAKYPGWIQIDLGKIATINRIFLGSDHSQGFADRATSQFDVLVAADEAAKDSAAASWKKAFSYNNSEKPIRGTTEFKFAATKGRYVRIHIIPPMAHVWTNSRFTEETLLQVMVQPYKQQVNSPPIGEQIKHSF